MKSIVFDANIERFREESETPNSAFTTNSRVLDAPERSSQVTMQPGIDPDDLELEVGVDRLCTEQERIDAAHDLWDREGSDVACDAALRHLRGDLSDNVPSFIKTG